MKVFIFGLIFANFFLFSSTVTFAAAPTIQSSIPSSILDNEVFELTASTSGTATGHIRVAIYKTGTIDYFGCTGLSPDQMYCGATCAQFPLAEPGQSVSLKVKVKDSDTWPDGYTGSGPYLLKVGRCTTGGFEWSNALPLTINTPPTPTPSLTPSPSPSPSPTVTPTPSPTPTPDPTGVQLSEVVACADDKIEWVELYNTNDASVTLNNWKILDDTGTSEPISGLTIPGKSYGTVTMSKVSLNDTGDTVKLRNSADSKMGDDFSYPGCTKGKSWSNFGSGWEQTNMVTKGKANERSSTITPTPTISPSPSPVATTTATPKATQVPLTPTPQTMAQSQGEQQGSWDLDETGQILGASTRSGQVSTASAKKKVGLFGIPYKALIPLGIGGFIFLGIGGYIVWEWKIAKKTAANAAKLGDHGYQRE